MLQWVAATIAARSIRYFTFREKRMVELSSIVELVLSRCTVGGLWGLLSDYVTIKGDQPAPCDASPFFDYVRQRLAPG